MEFDQLVHCLTTGLVRVAVAVQPAWQHSTRQGSVEHSTRQGAVEHSTRLRVLERTVAQQLALLLLSRRPGPHSLNKLAADLGMPPAAAQTTLLTLCREGLVTMDPSPSYAPNDLRVELTECGRAHTPEFLDWAEALLGELRQLGEDDHRRLLEAVTDRVVALQRSGRIPVTRMCPTCRHFDGYAHPGTPLPHHCRYFDAPFGHRQLRLRCPEHSPLPDA